MKRLPILVALLLFGCVEHDPAATSASETPGAPTKLVRARQKFATKVVRTDDPTGAPDAPQGTMFSLVRYPAPPGDLAAYVMPDPGDGKKHPAIVWIHGGDCNSIGDVWTPREPDNDQAASAFRQAGIIMMFPSLRGGNDNPGQREGFYGEVDDVLAATDYLEKLPYVDKDQIYLGGHSTGGTLVMLVGASTNRYQAIFSLGPVAAAEQYGGNYVYCDTSNKQEMALRSPVAWLSCVSKPMFVVEGELSENWAGAGEVMSNSNKNPNIKFFGVDGHDHFDVIFPVTKMLAAKILAGNVNVTTEDISQLKPPGNTP